MNQIVNGLHGTQAVLMRGDCLERMKEIPEGPVQLVFADLPYGVTAHKWDCVIDLHKMWSMLMSRATSSCAFTFTATQPFATDLINAQRDLFRYDLIWSKRKPSGFLSAAKKPLRYHEMILVFGKSVLYNPQMMPSKNYVATKGSDSMRTHQGMRLQNPGKKSGLSFPSSILSFSQPDLRTDTLNGNIPKRLHPTQKPVALLEWLIKTYTNSGDTVLDPTAGSGTTAVAALNTGRNAICIEKDPGYYDVMCRRVAESQQPPRQGELAV